MKKWVVCLLALSCAAVTTVALAGDAASGNTLGGMAGRLVGSMSNIARLITAAAYVAGVGFAVGGIVKFKAHKENPTQIPISTPIALVFVGASLIFIPNLIKTTGGSMYSGAQTAGPSGSANLGLTPVDSGKKS